MSSNFYQNQSNNKAASPFSLFISFPVLLAILAMFLFWLSVSSPEKAAMLVNNEKPGQDTQEMVKEAKSLKPYKLAESGRIADAVLGVQKLLAQKPDDVAVILCAALVLSKTSQKETAFSHIKRALALAPRNNFIRWEYARALAADGRFDEALAQYKLTISKMPKQADLRAELAQYFLNNNHPLDAAIELKELTKILPNSSSVHKMCGFALARAGKGEEGLDEYLSGVLLENTGGQPDALKLILVLCGGDIDKAKFQYEQQVSQRPQDPMLKLRLAQINLYENNVDEAKRLLFEARRLAPSNPEIHRSLCVVYNKMGDRKQALIEFLQSVAQDKNIEEQTNKRKSSLKLMY